MSLLPSCKVRSETFPKDLGRSPDRPKSLFKVCECARSNFPGMSRYRPGSFLVTSLGPRCSESKLETSTASSLVKN